MWRVSLQADAVSNSTAGWSTSCPYGLRGVILPVDALVADACGKLVARTEALGRPIEARDAFIAAIAQVNRLTLVTRNASHFQTTLKSILTPWTKAPS